MNLRLVIHNHFYLNKYLNNLAFNSKALVKFSDWDSIRVNQSYSKPSRNLCANQPEIDSNSFGFIRIEVLDSIELVLIRFTKNQFQNVFRISSDWFGNRFRNSSNSLGLNSNSKISARSMKIFFHSIKYIFLIFPGFVN